MLSARKGKRFDFWRSSLELCLLISLGSMLPLFGRAAPGPERVAHFLAEGKNEITSTWVTQDQRSSCTVTVTNVSAKPQNITLSSATITANGTNASKLEGPGVGSMTVVSPNSSLNWVFEYPTVPAGTAMVQNLVCKGKFTVADTNSDSPGFVIANGILGTFRENSTGKMILENGNNGQGKMQSTVSPHFASISIRSGTPF